MPPPPASVPTDALSKWGLWGDEESLKEVVMALLLYDDEHMDEDLVVYALASKGDQYKDMKIADVHDIWRCIKEKADDPRNPYRRFLAAKKDGSWGRNQEIQEIRKDLVRYKQRATVAASLQDMVDEEPGEGSS